MVRMTSSSFIPCAGVVTCSGYEKQPRSNESNCQERNEHVKDLGDNSSTHEVWHVVILMLKKCV